MTISINSSIKLATIMVLMLITGCLKSQPGNEFIGKWKLIERSSVVVEISKIGTNYLVEWSKNKGVVLKLTKEGYLFDAVNKISIVYDRLNKQLIMTAPDLSMSKWAQFDSID